METLKQGIPLGKVSVFAGESLSGKSFIVRNIVKAAQDPDAQVVLFDPENALDEEWLQALDVDTVRKIVAKLVLA